MPCVMLSPQNYDSFILYYTQKHDASQMFLKWMIIKIRFYL